MFDFQFSSRFPWIKIVVSPSSPVSLPVPPVAPSLDPSFYAPSKLEQALSSLDEDIIVDIHDDFANFFPKYNVINPSNFLMFLAQTMYESENYTVTTEDLNYSANGLMATWPSKFPTSQLANQYAWNPQAIANYVYANELGNGDINSGDGWNYRGRGLIQLTGKYNYQQFANAIGKDLTDTVSYLETMTGAVESACWFWQAHGLNYYTDFSDMQMITITIRGTSDTTQDRVQILNKIQSIFEGS